MQKKKIIVKSLLLISIMILSYSLSICFLKNGYENYTQGVINYEEINEVDYKVYLKENNFFDKPYLEKDGIYITSLIDYIDVDFNYNIKFDEKQTGKYKYYIKGIISATQLNNNGNYWQKDYLLSEEHIINFNDVKEIVFEENVKVDYQYYNDILLEFKKQFNLSLDGNLKIILCVENLLTNELVEHDLKRVSISTLKIPLTKATIEVPIEIINNNDEGTLKTELIYSDEIIYIVYKVIGFICFINGIAVTIILTLLFVKNKEKQSKFRKRIKSILKTYNSIIVNANNEPHLKNFDVIDVNDFSELLDAHSEVRLPILFIEKENLAMFVLINDKLAWRYIIMKDE